MPSLRHVLGASFVAAGFAACAYPDFQFSEEPIVSTTSTTTGGSGGTGAATSSTGGAGPTTSAGGAPTTSTSSTGGQTPCDPMLPGQCGPTEKCGIADPTTGEAGCVPKGTKSAWRACLDDTECDELLYCDDFTGVCKPLCVSSNTCPMGIVGDPGGVCLPLTHEGSDIPGRRGCTSYCNPDTAAPCGTSVACFYRFDPQDADDKGFDCASTQNKGPGESCSPTPPECGPGLDCAGGMCQYNCNPVGDSWPTCVFDCSSVDPPGFWEGEEWGLCL